MKFYIFILLFAFSPIVRPQLPNIRMDNDVQFHNIAILAQCMIDVFGEERVDSLLSNNASVFMTYELDGLGRMYDLKITRKKNCNITSADIDSILSYMQQNDIRTPIGFERTGNCIIEDFFDDAGRVWPASIEELYSEELPKLRNEKNGVIDYRFGNYGISDALSFYIDGKIYEHLTLDRLKQFIVKYSRPTFREMISNGDIALRHENDHQDSIEGHIHYDKRLFNAFDDINTFIEEGKDMTACDMLRVICNACSTNFAIENNSSFIAFLDIISLSINKNHHDIINKNIDERMNYLMNEFRYFIREAPTHSDSICIDHDGRMVISFEWLVPILFQYILEKMNLNTKLSITPEYRLLLKYKNENGNWMNIDFHTNTIKSDEELVNSIESMTYSMNKEIYFRPLSQMETLTLAMHFLTDIYKRRHRCHDAFTRICREIVNRKAPELEKIIIKE